MTPWTCFRYSKYLRKLTDTYLLRHRSRRRFPVNYRLLVPHWARTLCYRRRLGRLTVSWGSGYVLVPYRTGNRFVAFIASIDSTSGGPAPSTAAGTFATAVVTWTSVTGSTACSSCLDLSREGPFDVYCAPSDTGGHPLILDGLSGSPHRMTSYREEDVAESDPTFGSNFITHVSLNALGHMNQGLCSCSWMLA